MKYLQIHLNGTYSAENLLCQMAEERGADPYLTSEFYLWGSGGDRWNYSMDRACAIGTSRHSRFIHDKWVGGKGFTWFRFSNLIFYSCYYSPNRQLTDKLISSGSSIIPSTPQVGTELSSLMISTPRAPIGSRRNNRWVNNINDLDLLVANFGDVLPKMIS